MKLNMRSVVVGVLAGVAMSLALAAAMSPPAVATGQVVGAAEPRAAGPYQLATINVPSRYGTEIRHFVIDQSSASVWELAVKDGAASWKLVSAGPPKTKK